MVVAVVAARVVGVVSVVMAATAAAMVLTQVATAMKRNPLS